MNAGKIKGCALVFLGVEFLFSSITVGCALPRGLTVGSFFTIMFGLHLGLVALAIPAALIVWGLVLAEKSR